MFDDVSHLLPTDISALVNWGGGERPADYQRAAVQVCVRYVEEKYAHAKCAFLSGSFATATMSPTSDVDLFVIDEAVSQPSREQICRDNFRIQVGILSLADAFKVMDTARRHGRLFIIPAFSVAMHIFGDVRSVEKLKEIAQSLYNSGPEISRPMIRKYRVTLINNYIKLFRVNTPLERYGSVIKVVLSAGDYIQARSHSWVIPEVRYEKTLRESERYAEIASSVPDALRGVVEPLQRHIHELLEEDGPVEWCTELGERLPLF